MRPNPERYRHRLQQALGDDFVLGELIGQGGISLVFAARDRQLERTIAVKALREVFLATQNARDRFQREIRILARVRHPNIVPIYSVGEADGLAFMIMPRLQGVTLGEVLRKETKLAVPAAVRVTRGLAHALAAAHEHRVVHRDVKPDNIMLDGEERSVVLMDFGIAKALQDSQVSKEHWYRVLTATGVTFGAPDYMSPEQARADPAIDHRSDIYSLGVVAYEMLSGELPVTGSSAQQIFRKKNDSPPVELRVVRRQLSRRLCSVVMRCLATAAQDRWQSAHDLAEALKQVAV